MRTTILNTEEIILLGIFDTSTKEKAIRDILAMIPTMRIDTMRDQMMCLAMKLDRMKDSEFESIDFDMYREELADE